MTNFNLFDHYSLRARLQPALVALLPTAIGVFAWTGPGVRWVSALWTLLGTAGVTYFLAILARNQGKQLEPELWSSWGGTPTTQLLRYSGPANPVMRERWHKALTKLLGKPFPTAEEEQANPSGSDQIYEAAIKLLILKNRESKTTLIYKENVHYGFCRNLYAMRVLGIGASSLGVLASTGAGIWFLRNATLQPMPWVCAGICATFLFWWAFVVKSSWVKVPAFAYAERLLESVEKLPTGVKKTKSKKTDK